MLTKLEEPFKSYWNGKAKKPPLLPREHSINKEQTENQTDTWLKMKQSLQHTAQKKWG
ncbi:hypothetical protein RYX56_11500 [Alkalihalophilus lindianensis]|uniref:Uncharacterized protein n=1 Tax=Alkalihalophilus lindianensis TaxID=1630542 RepID=A0ABU3XAU1_9BACI|nr:hypothetical protein [Alkalihalophilus lindianensis]MDV2684995.1 hypothetical protein [Alkalihalophilus lindianensis]